MDTNIYEYVLKKLEDSKGRWTEVAEGSGISKRTIEKIARREFKDPGVSFIQRLADYFQASESKSAKRAA